MAAGAAVAAGDHAVTLDHVLLWGEGDFGPVDVVGAALDTIGAIQACDWGGCVGAAGVLIQDPLEVTAALSFLIYFGKGKCWSCSG